MHDAILIDRNILKCVNLSSARSYQFFVQLTSNKSACVDEILRGNASVFLNVRV